MTSPTRIQTVWKLYHADLPYSLDHEWAALTSQLADWFRGEGRKCIRDLDYTIKFRLFLSYKDIQACSVQKAAVIFDNKPKDALNILGVAAYLALYEGRPTDLEPSQDLVAAPNRRIEVRVLEHDVSAMKHLKANTINSFISVRGTVVRVSTIKPLLVSMTFVCLKCQGETIMNFSDGKYETPPCCSVCKGKNLLPDRQSAVTVDWQRIRLQEIVTDENREEGRMPRTVECELKDDLVESCIPGDVVVCSGIVKVLNTDESTTQRAKSKCLFLLYIDANSISNPKKVSGTECSFQQDLSRKDLQMVKEVAYSENTLQLLVHSLCPAIYGHEVVKLALLLALFGGTNRGGDSSNRVSVRSDSHILLVGEPGLGKSQLLQAVSNVAVRGVYVCGNTTSSAGLTVTVVKDAGGDYSLEAGALVLSDQGVCCIDEFDKMGNEQHSLLEAMEQQSISVAKAGIVCSLSARAAVIAAANPVGGHYNRGKTVTENLKMSRAILSRFDVIFILLDTPDRTRDQLLSEHVMALHSARGSAAARERQRSRWISTQRSRDSEECEDDSLLVRLQVPPGTEIDPLPPVMLRKYIAYARKYCFPQIGEAARIVLEDFYISLRERRHGMDSMPVTTRQLEALIRLAEARAKLDLREEVSERDALDVVDLIKESLMMDKIGDDVVCPDLPFAPITVGGRGGKGKQMQALLQLLQREANRGKGDVFSRAEIIQAAADGGLPGDAEALLELLNHGGYILQKGPRMYQLAKSV